MFSEQRRQTNILCAIGLLGIFSILFFMAALSVIFPGSHHINNNQTIHLHAPVSGYGDPYHFTNTTEISKVEPPTKK